MRWKCVSMSAASAGTFLKTLWLCFYLFLHLETLGHQQHWKLAMLRLCGGLGQFKCFSFPACAGCFSAFLLLPPPRDAAAEDPIRRAFRHWSILWICRQKASFADPGRNSNILAFSAVARGVSPSAAGCAAYSASQPRLNGSAPYA